jgi:hypothetical protein
MIDDILSRLRGVKSDGRSACCPAHEDRNASLSIGRGDDGRLLLCCHAGCATEDIVAALGRKMADLFEDRAGRGGGAAAPSNRRARAHTPPRALGADAVKDDPPDDNRAGLTLEQYAEAKALPIESLDGLGAVRDHL